MIFLKTAAAILLVVCGLSAGLSESMRLKARERELWVFSDALAALKSAAAYTAGDLYALLALCRENAFLRRVRCDGDLHGAWAAAARDFFTRQADRDLALAFLDGYGKTDLEGQLAYISLFEARTAQALEAARRDVSSKSRLYTMLGFFSGTVTALILI